jgi:hypothetical protein
MTTDKKTQSNRRNAQQSTGPKTEAGKEACAGNAMKHGLTARKYLRRDEDPAELTPIYDALCDTYEPKDAVMRDLVMKMAMCYLRANRAFIAEAEHSPLAEMLLGDHDNRIKNLVGYQAMVRKDLQFYERALAEHKKAWDARQKAVAEDNAEANSMETPDGSEEPEQTPRELKGPSPKKKEAAEVQTFSKAPPSTPATAAGSDQNAPAISAGGSVTSEGPTSPPPRSRASRRKRSSVRATPLFSEPLPITSEAQSVPANGGASIEPSVAAARDFDNRAGSKNEPKFNPRM